MLLPAPGAGSVTDRGSEAQHAAAGAEGPSPTPAPEHPDAGFRVYGNKASTMALKDQITDDMKTAMRAKDSARLGTIRLLLAAIKQKEVDERITLDDAAVTGIIDKLVKQRKDSIAAFTSAARMDLADKESAELVVLEGYLPQRMDAAEVRSAIDAIVAELAQELGRKLASGDMGRIMAVAKTRLAGKAEMAQVSAAVKAALAA
jgi:uncharacterized protein